MRFKRFTPLYVSSESAHKYSSRLTDCTQTIFIRQTENSKIVDGAQLAHKIISIDEDTATKVIQLGKNCWFVKDPNELIDVRTKRVHQKVAFGQTQRNKKRGFIVTQTVEHP